MEVTRTKVEGDLRVRQMKAQQLLRGEIEGEDLEREVVLGPGNVLESRQERNALRGTHGNALAGIARNVAELRRRRRVLAR